MPGRKFSAANGYRYGFGGQENDKDITIGDLDFGARIYDNRIGRWLSVDPLASKFPNESVYCYVGNNPIYFKDVKGKFKIGYKKGTEEYKAAMVVINAMRSEVESWKDESDPRFQAFKAATGAQSLSYIRNELLKDGHGPSFVWSDNSTLREKGTSGDDKEHRALLVAKGDGFEQGSSYAIHAGQTIYFDNALKDMALEIIQKESDEDIIKTNSYTFSTIDGTTYLVKDAKAEIKKAKTFLSRVGLHEGVHFLSGRAKVINPTQGNTGEIIYNDEMGKPVHEERGDYFERKAYGKVIQYSDAEAGTIPLRRLSALQRACNRTKQDCFPTDKAKQESYKKQNEQFNKIMKERGFIKS